MNNVSTSTPTDEPHETPAPDRWLTVPNAFCVLRLVGSFSLIPLALYENPMAFLVTYIALASTDWIDGKIARWFDQESRIGPKLDSASDVTMYAALLFGTVWLFGNTLLGEGLLIGAAVATYAASCLTSLLKFKRLPSYHTRSAKLSWFLTLAAVVALFLNWSIWPIRLAALCVALTNLEAILITLALSERKDNVPTIFHVRRRT